MPDPNDEHVAAAAVVGGAGALVTLNLKHFPRTRIPNIIEILTPAEFAFYTAEIDPERACRALRTMAERTGRLGPKWSERDLLAYLESTHGMGDMAELMRSACTGR